MTHSRVRQFRWMLLALTLLSAWSGVRLYYDILSVNGLNVLEAILLPVFAVLFTWVAFSFWTATLGFISLLISGDCAARRRAKNASTEASRQEAPLTQTAILMPIYNESPTRVLAGVQAMLRSLEATGKGESFDFFILSDTTDPDVWLEEERAWARLVAENGAHPRVFYRRRPRNVSRKSGNIADFCTRWGSQYEFMVVLDADSVMEGETLVEMVRRMEADPRLGILQVPPNPVNRQSFFARLQQFASQMYGPIFIEGFARWAGNDGNYWGHNAIIRVEPFARHCGLPRLPGKGPLGGEILSHDFVEAALMARAGYKVSLATDLGGSYEECPTTLLDFAKRDQRWCQGNMQHIRLIFSENFRPISRLHLSMGAMSYLSSPIWMLFMLLSGASMLLDAFQGSAFATQGAEAAQVWGGAGLLFAVTMGMLLIPKLWSMLVLVRQPSRLQSLGGWDNVIGSVTLETIVSILIAPIMMYFHTRFVIATISGEKVQWTAQKRGDSEADLGATLMDYGPHTLIGLVATVLVACLSPSLLPWFLPVTLGLIFAVPLAQLLGSATVGKRLEGQGLLLIPEEIAPPEILHLHQEAAFVQDRACNDFDRSKLFDSVLHDPAFHALHRNILQATDANVKASPAELKEIIATIDREGPSAVSREARRILLSDADALRDLHVKLRSQLRLNRSALSS